MLVVGPNKKQLQLASYYCKNIVKLKLRWSYSSFKLISIEFKQNLGLGCSNFYSKGSRWQNLKILIHKNFVWARAGGSPPGLNVTPPMIIIIIIIIITSHYLFYKENNGSNVLSPTDRKSTRLNSSHSRRSKWKNLKIFIYKNFVWARSAGSFEPPGLNVKLPMISLACCTTLFFLRV